MQNDQIEVDGNKNTKLSLRPFLFLLILFVCMAIILSTTSPNGGPVYILIFWLMLFLLLLSFVYATLFIIKRSLYKKISTRSHLYLSINFSLGLIMVLGLKSLGQLDLIDLILVASFEFISNFYILRRF